MLRTTTLFAFLGFSLLYFTSYSSGPTGRAGDATGSPLTQTACTTCHQGGNFAPVTEINFLDEGAAIMAYEPGKTYTLQLSTTAQNNPSGYGFQAVILDAANANAGEFGTPPANFKLTTDNAREYFEQRRVQTASSVEVEWTAPVAGTGEVTIYVGGNAINANGGTSGDNANLVSLSLAEGTPSSTSAVNASSAFKAYQSSSSRLTLEFGEQLALPVQYTIRDISGKVLQVSSANTSEVTTTVEAGTSQMVVVVVKDARGRTGAQQIVLR